MGSCGWLVTASGCSKQVLLHMHDTCACVRVRACLCLCVCVLPVAQGWCYRGNPPTQPARWPCRQSECVAGVGVEPHNSRDVHVFGIKCNAILKGLSVIVPIYMTIKGWPRSCDRLSRDQQK